MSNSERYPNVVSMVTAMIAHSSNFRDFVQQPDECEAPIEEHLWAAAETAAEYVNTLTDDDLTSFQYDPVYFFIEQTYGTYD